MIQRRLVARLGRRCPHSGLRDMPEPARVAALAPAELESLDLAHRRALALRRCAREVAAGRIDLADREQAWPRLARDPGRRAVDARDAVAATGRAATTCVPAGDLGYLKLVGRLTTGNPQARADEAEVRGFFERYGEWKGLAGTYLVIAAATGLLTEPPRLPGRAPRPAGTRWSAPPPRSAAA